MKKFEGIKREIIIENQYSTKERIARWLHNHIAQERHLQISRGEEGMLLQMYHPHVLKLNEDGYLFVREIKPQE